MIARSTPVWDGVLPEFQSTSAAPVGRQVYAGLAEPPEPSAAALEEPRARAAEPTRMAADPSCPGQVASNAIGLAVPIPKLGSPGDYRRMAVASGRSERGSR
ncbi:MAG TPA: hypothetical protein VK542_08865 [Gemmatimonadaceae bacterium]|nr:hypothetical protein [Gemmatimonadaceae bacterium]